LIPLLMEVDTTIYNNFNDVSISAYMKDNNIPIFHLENMLNYRCEMMISDQEYTNQNYDNILYFRIRNSSHELDIMITKFLLNKLYNITV